MEGKYKLILKYIILLLVGIAFYEGLLSNLNFQIKIGNCTTLKFIIGNIQSDVNKVDIKQNIVINPFIPVRIYIPDIQVDAKVIPVKIEDGQINAPLDFAQIGWSEASAKIGSSGTVIMNGHYDSRIGPAVLYRLKNLK